MNKCTLEEFDALFVVVAEYLSLATFDEYVQRFEHDVGIHAVEI